MSASWSMRLSWASTARNLLQFRRCLMRVSGTASKAHALRMLPNFAQEHAAARYKS